MARCTCNKGLCWDHFGCGAVSIDTCHYPRWVWQITDKATGQMLRGFKTYQNAYDFLRRKGII